MKRVVRRVLDQRGSSSGTLQENGISESKELEESTKEPTL